MANKKKKAAVSGEVLMQVLGFLKGFKHFDFWVMEEQDYPMIMELFEDKDDDYLLQFDRVVKCSLVLSNADFINVVNDLEGKEYIRTDVFINLIQLDNELFILELLNDKTTKKSRKSKIELELELDEAVEKEDYELASKLKTRIEKMK